MTGTPNSRQAFDALLKASGVEPIVLPPRSPNLNAHCERFVRSIKEEALDQMVMLGERAPPPYDPAVPDALSYGAQSSGPGECAHRPRTSNRGGERPCGPSGSPRRALELLLPGRCVTLGPVLHPDNTNHGVLVPRPVCH